jgi:hypothetical protein
MHRACHHPQWPTPHARLLRWPIDAFWFMSFLKQAHGTNVSHRMPPVHLSLVANPACMTVVMAHLCSLVSIPKTSPRHTCIAFDLIAYRLDRLRERERDLRKTLHKNGFDGQRFKTVLPLVPERVANCGCLSMYGSGRALRHD